MDDIESRLRQYRPRRPAAIPDERLQRLRGPIWLGVAATLAAMMLIVSWLQRPAPTQSRQLQAVDSVALGPLTTLAIERPEELDAALTRISLTTLPDVTRPGGVLQPLAKGL